MNTATHSLLVTLERLDGALREIGQRLAAGPARLDRLARESERLAAQLQAAAAALERTRGERRDRERRIEELSGRIATFESQLVVIKSNDEYQAMRRQIGDTRERRAALENEALDLMEREEELAGKLAQDRARIEEELEAIQASEAAIRRELEREAAERERLRGERRDAMAGLDPELRRLYERIHDGKDALAVVAVTKGACGGCFSALPPQRVNEARLGEELLLCEACGRILIWDEETSSR